MSPARLGQHFLKDKAAVAKIADIVFATLFSAVAEIGPGRGALTDELVARLGERRLFAIELDRDLASRLRGRFKNDARVAVIEGDARSIEAERLPFVGGGAGSGDNGAAYALAGNLPYYAALPIMRNFINMPAPPKILVCMLQNEVADALCAPVGKRGFIGAVMQTYGETRKRFELAPSCFEPPPKVRSAVVQIELYPQPRVPQEHLRPFFQFVKIAFAGSRKQIINSLSGGLPLPKQEARALLESCAVAPAMRPQELSLEQFKRLYFGWRALQANG